VLSVTGAPPAVSLLIFAFNEEQHLGDTIAGAITTLEGLALPFEVVVVDDGSTDRTPVVARAAETDARVRVISHRRNRGLGASYATGVRAARGEYVTWLPGDDAIPSESLVPMLAVRRTADVVITYPVFAQPRPWLRGVLSSTYVRLINGLFGLGLQYYNCVTLVRRETLLPVLPRVGSGFGVFAEVLVRLLLAGGTYRQIPVTSRDRPLERSKALRWRNFSSVCRQILWLWWSVRATPRRPQDPPP
jgi:glycosyltransferase involved in cell wall biosynthesis